MPKQEELHSVEPGIDGIEDDTAFSEEGVVNLSAALGYLKGERKLIVTKGASLKDIVEWSK